MERIEKKELKKLIRENVKTLYRKTLENASPEELYQAAVFAVRDVITDKWMKTHDEYYERDAKVVYYLSMEFLMGRFFGNALINLEMFDEVKEVFAELGIDYNMVEEAEPDPGPWQRRPWQIGGLLSGIPFHAFPAGLRLWDSLSLRHL